VVLTEERVVVSKETVPVERVRLGTETITEQREVTETVRKEQIEFDDADRTGHEGSALDADARTRNGEQRR
jgi:stress response protein YsnF